MQSATNNPETQTAQTEKMNHMDPFKNIQEKITTCEEFDDTKGAIRNRKYKKNRQHHGLMIKNKMTNNDLQNIQIQQKIE